MLGSKEHEVIEALAPQRADEALHERLAIRRPGRRLHDFHALSPQGLIKFRREFGIAIMLQVANPHPAAPGLLHKQLGLVLHPAVAGVKDRRRKDDPPRLQMQKHQEESVSEALQGQHLLTDKVALPEAGGMFPEKLIPGFLRALGTGIESSGFKNIADIGDADTADAELLSSPTIRR